MPSAHKFPARAVRIPPELWGRARSKAEATGLTMTGLVWGWMAAYLDGRLDPMPIADDERAARQTGRPPVDDETGSHGDTAADLQQGGVEVLGCDEDVAGLRPLLGADDTMGFHQVHEPPGLGEADS